MKRFFIYTQQFSFLSFISLGLVDGRVRDDQSFWRAEGEDHLQVCGRRPAPFCVHVARSHSGTLTFEKEVDPKKERSTLEVR